MNCFGFLCSETFSVQQGQYFLVIVVVVAVVVNVAVAVVVVNVVVVVVIVVVDSRNLLLKFDQNQV